MGECGKIYENTRVHWPRFGLVTYPDVRDDNKFYIEKNSYTIESRGKERQIAFISLVAVRIIARTAMSRS